MKKKKVEKKKKKHSYWVKCNTEILCSVGCTPYVFRKRCNLEGTSTVRGKERNSRTLTTVYQSLIQNF